MAEAVQVAGLATIKVDTGSAHALETLGYTINGVEFEENTFTLPVHGDQHGGDSGPPIDIQFLGQVDTVRMEMSKYDEAVLDKLRANLWNSGFTTPAAGQILDADIGALFFGGSKFFRLAIDAANSGFDRDYIKVIFTEPKSFNRGVKHSIVRLTATCYREPSPGAGVARVYDSSVAAVSLPDDPIIVQLGANGGPDPVEILKTRFLEDVRLASKADAAKGEESLATYAHHWPEFAGKVRYLFGSFTLESTERLLSWVQAKRRIDEAAALAVPLNEVLEMLGTAGARYKKTGELARPRGR